MDLESPVIIRNIVNGDEPAQRGSIQLAAGLGGGFLRIRNGDGAETGFLGALFLGAVLSLGGELMDGNIVLKNGAGDETIALRGGTRRIELKDHAGDLSVVLDGEAGDLRLLGADAAEDFDVVDGDVSPGTVMVISDDGRLRASCIPYDRLVAGVVSGAGHFRPGLVLGRSDAPGTRRPLALAGKVCVHVDATADPIGVGDLLTTSATPGHAMRATDQGRAFGAVLGKALAPLETGRGLIPALVALQ